MSGTGRFKGKGGAPAGKPASKGYFPPKAKKAAAASASPAASSSASPAAAAQPPKKVKPVGADAGKAAGAAAAAGAQKRKQPAAPSSSSSSSAGDSSAAPAKKFKKAPWTPHKPKEAEVAKVFTKEERRQIKKDRRARKPHGEALVAANKLWKVSLSKIGTEDQVRPVTERF